MKNGNGKPVQYKGYVAGWLDSSIPDFLEELPEIPESMAFALLTCLDSNLRPATLLKKSPELKTMAKSIRVVGDGILVPTMTLIDADRKSPVFHGFDEVWFFPSDTIEGKPAGAWLVGPQRVAGSTLRKLGPWMTEFGCSLALGDGEGLNVVVKEGTMAKHLVAHSLTQPQPAAAE